MKKTFIAIILIIIVVSIMGILLSSCSRYITVNDAANKDARYGQHLR